MQLFISAFLKDGIIYFGKIYLSLKNIFFFLALFLFLYFIYLSFSLFLARESLYYAYPIE